MADGNIIATVLTGAAVLVGVWRLIESVRRDLTTQISEVRRDLGGQISDVNKRIDNVLLADRRRAS